MSCCNYKNSCATIRSLLELVKMKPCKHLDYDEQYPGCEIIDLSPDYQNVKYWHRLILPDEASPTKVQFCKRFGRINGIFDCYQDGPFRCHEA